MSPCYLADATCKLFHCHKFFFQHGLHNISQSSWAQRWGKNKRCQNRGHANLSVFPCHPTPFGQKYARRGVRVFSNFFLKFQWKNSPQKSRRNHPRMERKRPFFLSPSHLHRTSSPDQVRELERKPPLHRLGVDSMQVGPNFRLQTLRSLMKSWYIPFNCPKHAFFRGCFTWMINQPFTWKNGSTLGFQVITTVLIPYKSTPINHL